MSAGAIHWAVAGIVGVSDYPIGTAYKAGGTIRTAKHVADYGKAIGWPGQTYPIAVACVDDATDSALLRSPAPLVDLPATSTLPNVGAPVTLIGLRLGQSPVAIMSQVVSYIESVRVERRFVGPMVMMPFRGNASGMSGGPVLHGGRAFATISAQNGEHVFAVPLSAAACGRVAD